MVKINRYYVKQSGRIASKMAWHIRSVSFIFNQVKLKKSTNIFVTLTMNVPEINIPFRSRTFLPRHEATVGMYCIRDE